MMDFKTKIHSTISQYYSEKIISFGSTPKGVDWNDKKSQEQRFVQLMKVVENKNNLASIVDIGCGYGALYEFLKKENVHCRYSGIDLSKEMIEVAKAKFKEDSNAIFLNTHVPNFTSDYAIASGIFNVKMDLPSKVWLDHVKDTLEIIDKSSSLGFSVNFLSSKNDKEKIKKYLFYANPDDVYNLCYSRYSKNVEIIENYGLYEFTIIVRKKI